MINLKIRITPTYKRKWRFISPALLEHLNWIDSMVSIEKIYEEGKEILNKHDKELRAKEGKDDV